MSLEMQVCSLELAIKLNELGIKQESLFYWHKDVTWRLDYWTEMLIQQHENYSAFTVGELMELLPPYIDTKQNDPFNIFGFNLIKCSSHNIRYICNYHCDCSQVDSGSPYFALKLIKHNIYDEKLADCLAKTLIYLLEEGFIKNDA